MSNKHYRKMAPQVIQAPLSPRPPQAIKAPKPEDLTDAQMLARAKRYLLQVISQAGDCLAAGEDLISVREALNASRSLLAIMKHEQRLREHARKVATEDRAAEKAEFIASPGAALMKRVYAEAAARMAREVDMARAEAAVANAEKDSPEPVQPAEVETPPPLVATS